jgi:hypothetical protein
MGKILVLCLVIFLCASVVVSAEDDNHKNRLQIGISEESSKGSYNYNLEYEEQSVENWADGANLSIDSLNSSGQYYCFQRIYFNNAISGPDTFRGLYGDLLIGFEEKSSHSFPIFGGLNYGYKGILFRNYTYDVRLGMSINAEFEVKYQLTSSLGFQW